MPIEARKCSDCDKLYHLLWRTKPGGEVEYSALDHADWDHLSCPCCNSDQYEKRLTTGSGIQMGGSAGVGKHYPYYDHGLGEMVESAQHRAAICKARGLVPVEGRESALWEDQADKERHEIEADKQAWAQQERQFRETNRSAYEGVMAEARRETERMREQERATVQKNREDLAEAMARLAHNRRR